MMSITSCANLQDKYLGLVLQSLGSMDLQSSDQLFRVWEAWICKIDHNDMWAEGQGSEVRVYDVASRNRVCQLCTGWMGDCGYTVGLS